MRATRPVHEHAVLDLVDADLRPDCAELLLEQASVLPAWGAGRGDEQSEGELHAVSVADPVTVRVAPAPRREQAGGLRGVVRKLARLGIPDPRPLGHRTRGDLPEVSEHALQQVRAVHRHREGPADVAVAEDGMRPCGVALRDQVEPEVGVV